MLAEEYMVWLARYPEDDRAIGQRGLRRISASFTPWGASPPVLAGLWTTVNHKATGISSSTVRENNLIAASHARRCCRRRRPR